MRTYVIMKRRPGPVVANQPEPILVCFSLKEARANVNGLNAKAVKCVYEMRSVENTWEEDNGDNLS